RLSVRDEGIGIPTEMHRKIFERFTRVREGFQARGLGLGLFICRYIVNAHGGRIEVKSSPGEGSEFSVFLPL
ncbi:MAG: hybrid sensor histidine kinase/response regulator, partial [Proteobacteria bacterium]|nr:hybrid sensor histidine kinase/response regulator [Pseudomonadota bacterium]